MPLNLRERGHVHLRHGAPVPPPRCPHHHAWAPAESGQAQITQLHRRGRRHPQRSPSPAPSRDPRAPPNVSPTKTPQGGGQSAGTNTGSIPSIPSGPPTCQEKSWGTARSQKQRPQPPHKKKQRQVGGHVTALPTHFRPALPLTRSSQGWSSGRNSLSTMPYFLRRASSRSLRLNSLPAPDSGSSSSW